MRSGRTQCYGNDGTFGIAVPGLYEDNSGALWVLAQSGLWRWRPGPPVRYATTPVEVSALTARHRNCTELPAVRVSFQPAATLL